MANTFKHKLIAKFNNGLIELEDIPINIKKLWNRHNFDAGNYRKKRINIKIKTLNHDVG